jgi:hypothetical protein
LWVRADPVQTQRKEQSGKHLVECLQQIMNYFWIFKFPEISNSKVVTWQAHVDDKTSTKEAAFDMIMGKNLMTSIGITVDCEQRCIRWGGTEIQLKTGATLNNDEILHMLYHAANEPDILQEAEKRQSRI